MPDAASFWDDPFEGPDRLTGPPLTDEMIEAAQASLGYHLPRSYLRLIRIQNGGSIKRRCFPMSEPAPWGTDYLRVEGIRGIGGGQGIDSGTSGSREMIQGWGYPDVGVVVGEMPSGGHDAIMLDYSECGPTGEPAVIHVETETDDAPRIREVAPDFETFLLGLVDCAHFEDDADPELAPAAAARIRRLSGGHRRRRPGLMLVLAVLVLYLAGYLWFRSTHREVWARDGRAYVIFPAGAPAVYYLYRPLSYADAALTGTGSHVGPHR